jgi:oligopeptide/dipeptide ABC transporter ATP-binding protein
MALLDIRDLSVRYEEADEPDTRAVDGVSFGIDEREIFGLVGESGCGKSTLGKAIVRLLDANGSITGGEVAFKGRDLVELSDAEIRDVRWAEISIVPQGSMSGLNPVYRVGEQIVEAIRRHEPETSLEAAHARARELLERVGVEASRADDFPHQLSGGMKQRAMIAMALSCDPDLLIADEPTTALDAIVQDKVLAELEAIQRELDMAVLLVSHDVGVIAETCDRVGVMYGGKLMEIGETDDVFGTPANPYTLGLTRSFPDIESTAGGLVSLPGHAPSLQDPPAGCRFRSRCPFATETCETEHPPLYTVDGDHRSACYHLDRLEEMRAAAGREETWH